MTWHAQKDHKQNKNAKKAGFIGH